MLVSELVKKLSTFPQDAVVAVYHAQSAGYDVDVSLSDGDVLIVAHDGQCD